MCVPNDRICKQYVMWSVHDHPTAGHMGSRKTYMMLARQFYWPGMVLYSKAYVEACNRCRAAKSVTSKPNGLLQSLQIPNRRWAQVSLDFITGLPRSINGNDAILTLVDTVSKMAHFIPTKTTISAAETVELLADRLVRYHGFPTTLISDRDTRFVSELWANFCERFKIKRALSSAWHPQTDGQTERVHRTLEQILRTYIQTDESAWEGLLPAAELAYNCTVHNSTGMTPFETMIGENPLRAIDLDLNDTLEPTITPPMTKIFQQLVDRAAVHILQAQALQKHYADQKGRKLSSKKEKECGFLQGLCLPEARLNSNQDLSGHLGLLSALVRWHIYSTYQRLCSSTPFSMYRFYRKIDRGMQTCYRMKPGNRSTNSRDLNMKWSTY